MLWPRRRTWMSIAQYSVRGVALLMLALTSGAASAPPTTSPTDAARYSDPVYNFSLAVPAFAPAKERSLIATFQGPAEDNFSSNVTLVVDPGKAEREAYLKA